MATYNYIQVPPASTGLKIDAAELVNGANTVERQVMTIGDANTAAQVAAVNAQLQLSVDIEGKKSTYGAAAVGFSAGTGATTDIFTLYGSASKTIRVLKVLISSTTATAAVYYDYIIARRSTAFTGGTAGTPTVTKFDSTAAAGTAVAKNFTAAPTAGTDAGILATAKYFSPITGTPALGQAPLEFSFGDGILPAVVLRGVAEGLAITINGVTPANAQAHNISVFWTEE